MHYWTPDLVFTDRTEAGQLLGQRLERYRKAGPVVIALPRGGVPVGVEVAGLLGADLDLVIVRKIPIPFEPEAGYGAVTEDGTAVLNDPMVRQLHLSRPQIDRHVSEVRGEIARRAAVFRAKLPKAEPRGRTAIIVDDGLASGFTMAAAIQSIRNRQAREVVVAVPTASESAYDLIAPIADDLVALTIGRGPYFAVAGYYRNWHDLTDQEVLSHLDAWIRNRETQTYTGGIKR